MRTLKRFIPVLIVLGFAGLLVYQLVAEGAVDCRVCITFNGQRQCVTAKGPDEATARTEAHNSACARIARGMTDSIACPNQPPDQVVCNPR